MSFSLVESDFSTEQDDLCQQTALHPTGHFQNKEHGGTILISSQLYMDQEESFET